MRTLPPFLLFDLDDTLLDFTSTGDRCWETLCAAFAPRLGLLPAADLLAAINQVRGWYWSDPERHRQGRLGMQDARRRIVRLSFETLGLEAPEIADELADAFTQQREELVLPFPGAVETLQSLRERGVRMGLITNGTAHFQRRKIQRFGMAPFFELIQIESEFGVGKPEPAAFLHALRCLDAAPGQAWMVGDDLEYDIRPAQALGMGTVWVDRAGKGLPPECRIQPAWIVKRIAELVGEGPS